MHRNDQLARWSKAELLLKTGILHFEMARFEEATTYLKQAFCAGGYAAFVDADPKYLQLIGDFVERRVSHFRLAQQLLRFSLVPLIAIIAIVVRDADQKESWFFCIAMTAVFLVLRFVTLKLNPYSKDFPDPRPKRRPTVLPPNLSL